MVYIVPDNSIVLTYKIFGNSVLIYAVVGLLPKVEFLTSRDLPPSNTCSIPFPCVATPWGYKLVKIEQEVSCMEGDEYLRNNFLLYIPYMYTIVYIMSQLICEINNPQTIVHCISPHIDGCEIILHQHTGSTIQVHLYNCNTKPCKEDSIHNYIVPW